MNLTLKYLAAVDCGQPPIVEDAVTSFTETTFSSDVTYTCLDGYFFARLVYTQTVTCLENGTWSQITSLYCTRKYDYTFIGVLWVSVH